MFAGGELRVFWPGRGGGHFGSGHDPGHRTRAILDSAGGCVFSQYSGSTPAGFSPEPIWRHSLQVGFLWRARLRRGETKNVRIADTAFTAGLLHDIGQTGFWPATCRMFSMRCEKKADGQRG